MPLRHRLTLKILSLLLIAACLVLPAGDGRAPAEAEAEEADCAVSVALDFDSDTAKLKASVHLFVDGDTTHFSVSDPAFPTGILKARYLAVNTPESTGKIEPYGKQASEFTRQRLSGARDIVVESDDGNWNRDSTGERTLVWVWYTPDGETWRCLNIELLQEGLAIANASSRNRYGEACMAAISRAREEKRKIYSGEKDPDFWYGDAVELTLRELRLNAASYDGIKVAFEGIVTVNHSNSVYVEAFDSETGLNFGMPVYYGYGLSGGGLEILRPGNLVRIVGTLQYYGAAGVWQVSGITYRMMKPDDPGNIRLISAGHEIPWTGIDAHAFAAGTVTAAPDEDAEAEEYEYAALIQATTVSVAGLTVQGGYALSSGDLTLWCLSGGDTVQLYLSGALDRDGKPFTLEGLRGKTVDVRGIASQFNGEYQIDVLTPDGIALRQ